MQNHQVKNDRIYLMTNDKWAICVCALSKSRPDFKTLHSFEQIIRLFSLLRSKSDLVSLIYSNIFPPCIDNSNSVATFLIFHKTSIFCYFHQPVPTKKSWNILLLFQSRFEVMDRFQLLCLEESILLIINILVNQIAILQTFLSPDIRHPLFQCQE